MSLSYPLAYKFKIFFILYVSSLLFIFVLNVSMIVYNFYLITVFAIGITSLKICF